MLTAWTHIPVVTLSMGPSSPLALHQHQPVKDISTVETHDRNLFRFSTSATSSSVENCPLTTKMSCLMASSPQSTSSRPPTTTGRRDGFTYVPQHTSRIFTDTQQQATYTTVPTLLLTKNPGLFQDPMKNFPGPFRSLRMFQYKEKNGTYLQYSECSPLCQNSSTFHTVFK